MLKADRVGTVLLFIGSLEAYGSLVLASDACFGQLLDCITVQGELRDLARRRYANRNPWES